MVQGSARKKAEVLLLTTDSAILEHLLPTCQLLSCTHTTCLGILCHATYVPNNNYVIWHPWHSIHKHVVW